MSLSGSAACLAPSTQGDPESEDPGAPLLLRAKAGDSEALSELLESCREMVFGLAYRFTGSAEEAEDLAQETLVRVLRALPSYRAASHFRTWVYRVALNTCTTAYTRRASSESLTDRDVTWSAAGPEEQALQQVFAENARQEITRLPGPLRDAVVLRVVEHRSYAEIAEILEIPLNTALTRVHRGVKRLRERLKAWLD